MKLIVTLPGHLKNKLIALTIHSIRAIIQQEAEMEESAVRVEVEAGLPLPRSAGRFALQLKTV
jgi:hypothetical protein